MSSDAEKFEQSSRQPRSSLLGEFGYFLVHHKKWWLLPILLILAIMGLLAFLSTTGAAPWIYPFV